MRSLLAAALLLLIGPIAGAFGETAPHHVGIVRTIVANATGTPFDMLVWYPTDADEVPWRTGPFTIPASRDAAIADGRFPIVLLSHGGGASGGTPLLLGELSADLARHGFVVIAPFHGKTGLQGRTEQMAPALQAVLTNPRFASHVDAARLGMLGFSLGTTVALELAGAIPNTAYLETYCAAHPDDVLSCNGAPDGNNGPRPGQPRSARPLRAPAPLPLKAIALLDPFAVLFQQRELSAVTMPVVIFRPGESEMHGEVNAFGLATGLPRPPQFENLPGGHFIFIDVCSAALDAEAPEVCRDPPGVDRRTVHTAVESKLAEFFRQNL